VVRIHEPRHGEIDLFFDWNVDMYRTLELVQCGSVAGPGGAASHRQITANRLTSPPFPSWLQPDLGQGLADALWELATYETEARV